MTKAKDPVFAGTCRDCWKNIPSITKREHFAALAMQGDIANGDVVPEGPRARYWLRCADALIAELNKGTESGGLSDE